MMSDLDSIATVDLLAEVARRSVGTKYRLSGDGCGADVLVHGPTALLQIIADRIDARAAPHAVGAALTLPNGTHRLEQGPR